MKMCIDFVQCPTVVRTVGFQSVYKWFIVCFVSIFEFWYMYYLKRKIQQIVFDVLLISSEISGARTKAPADKIPEVQKDPCFGQLGQKAPAFN